jgi:hypothetical protein
MWNNISGYRTWRDFAAVRISRHERAARTRCTVDKSDQGRDSSSLYLQSLLLQKRSLAERFAKPSELRPHPLHRARTLPTGQSALVGEQAFRLQVAWLSGLSLHAASGLLCSRESHIFYGNTGSTRCTWASDTWLPTLA